ncbi:uncharacterized protein VTP21DRAFT_8009 [Calcarisporiella thermophila]|uniref:uncharacterized protein n=1 Tax=Calcarisporiella thermophila TaxID=911321 RepID=UPI003744978D
MVASTASLKALPQNIIRLWDSQVTRVSLKQIYTVGKSVLASKDQSTAMLVPTQFLHEELPVRLSHTVRLLNSPDSLLPHELAQTPAVQHVTLRYLEDITMLTNLPRPDTPSKASEFSEIVKRVRERQHENVLAIGKGLEQLVKDGRIVPQNPEHEERAQSFFDRFYGMALGVDLLLGEHIALHHEGRNLVQRLRVGDIARSAAEETRRVLHERFGREAPGVEIVCRGGNECNTMYIPDYLRRVIFEILHPSLRASMLQPEAPPVKVVVVEGEEDVSIKISDQGGGFPISAAQRIWSYLANPAVIPAPHDRPSAAAYPHWPLPTYGHGMPVARLIARYFGGELSVVSMEGYGTDTYFALYRDETYPENLPVPQLSPGANLGEMLQAKKAGILSS